MAFVYQQWKNRRILIDLILLARKREIAYGCNEFSWVPHRDIMLFVMFSYVNTFFSV